MDLALIFFVSGIVFGGACAIVATNKKRDPLGWFVLGFLFSLIALIVIAALSPNAGSPDRKRTRSGMKKANGDFVDNPQDPERPWLG